ncbi:hypothetical protein SNEBB_005960 [Seison nebaliae]|nr:hypothetical protein SNEBB_005960 [Seison nebaliae]
MMTQQKNYVSPGEFSISTTSSYDEEDSQQPLPHLPKSQLSVYNISLPSVADQHANIQTLYYENLAFLSDNYTPQSSPQQIYQLTPLRAGELMKKRQEIDEEHKKVKRKRREIGKRFLKNLKENYRQWWVVVIIILLIMGAFLGFVIYSVVPNTDSTEDVKFVPKIVKELNEDLQKLYKKNFPDLCGMAKKKSSATIGRIVGGNIVNPNSYPWVVLILSERAHSEGYKLCAGALLNNNFVLTAAHCYNNINNVSLYFGIHKYTEIHDKNSDIQARTAAIFERHPDYEALIEKNDIALVRLNKPVTYTNKISPICLPAPSEVHELETKPMIVSGWGYTTYNGKASVPLRQVIVRAQPIDICADRVGVRVNRSNQICAGDIVHQLDSCNGDSGSPLMVKMQRNVYFPKKDKVLPKHVWIQTGLVSFGDEFCQGYGIYTRIGSYLSWIIRTVNRLNEIK